MNKSVYFKNLDGLRFICFLLVFFYHSFHTTISEIKTEPVYIFVNRLFENGHLGVNIFFVLSGFLITYLLLAEISTNKKINIKKFWARRILRIWPLYYACVLFGFYAFPYIKTLLGATPNETANLLHYIFFIGNFDFIKSGADSSVLGVLWSIAIEEQFYLFWPLLFLLFKSNVKLLYSFLFLIILSYCYNIIQTDSNVFNFHTLVCIGDLSVGGVFAFIFHEHDKIRAKFRKINRSYFFINLIILIILLLNYNDFSSINSVSRVLTRFGFSIFIGILISELSFHPNPILKFSKSKTLSYLGRLTYGLYTLHFIGILITINISKVLEIEENIFTVVILNTLISLLISIAISYISFNYYEKVFLKLKNKKYSVKL